MFIGSFWVGIIIFVFGCYSSDNGYPKYVDK